KRTRKNIRKLQDKTLNTLKNSNAQEDKSIEVKGLNNSIENINRYAPTIADSAKSTAKFAGKTLAKANYKTKELISKRTQELAKTIGNIKIKNTNSSSNFKSSKSVANPVNVKVSLKQRKTNTSNSNMNKAIMPNKKSSKKKLKKQLKNKFFSNKNRLGIRKIIKNIDIFWKPEVVKMVRKIISSIGLMFSPIILIGLVLFVVLAGAFGGNKSHKSSEIDLMISKSGFAVPVEKPLISSHFGWREYPLDPTKKDFHTGIDFIASFGDPIFATLSGKVKDVGYPFPNQDYGGYDTGEANYIVLDHGNGIESAYWHLKSVLVKPGDTVEQGSVIGTAGSTGYSTGCHLHFEIRDYNLPAIPGTWANQIDPFPILFGVEQNQKSS
ncbi:M23 family metallopeptidase, partial [Varibaculum cambriense]|uniref:M23 family metallopeptidase n=1 Tax=Varibaculum cambriense TaxID=184870 RepID=UPI00255585A2